MSASANPRRPPESPYRFAARAFAAALLVAVWPAPREAYPALFHAHANALLASVEAPHVRLSAPAHGSRADVDTALRGARHPGAPTAWESTFSVVRIGYWPSAALATLLLATPLPALRRALAVAGGLALVDLFTLARIGVEIAYASYEVAHGPGGPTQGPAHLLLRVGSESLTATIPSAAFVLVCWVILARPQHAVDVSALRAWVARPRS